MGKKVLKKEDIYQSNPIDSTYSPELQKRILDERNAIQVAHKQSQQGVYGSFFGKNELDVDSNFFSPKGMDSSNPYARYGHSTYDFEGGTFDNLTPHNQIRDDNQGWFTSLITGLGRTTTTAATTALQNIAAVGGIVPGMWNGMVDTVKTGSFTEGFNSFVSSLWDGQMNKDVNAIDQTIKEYLKVHRSEAEQNSSVWSNIFSEGIFEEMGDLMGFVAGASMGGGLFSKILNKGGRMSNASHLLTTSVLTSMGESAVESIHTTGDFLKKGIADAENRFYTERGLIMQDPTLSEEEKTQKLDELARQFTVEKQAIEKAGKRVGNYVFGLNMAILTPSNAYAFAKPWLNGDAMAAKKMFNKQMKSLDDKLAAGEISQRQHTLFKKQLVGKYERGAFAEAVEQASSSPIKFNKDPYGFIKEAFTNLSKNDGYDRVLGRMLSEGLEEKSQGIASDASTNYFDSLLYYMRDSKFEREADDININMLNSIINSTENKLGSSESWYEFMLGAIAGLTGSPTIARNAQGNLTFWQGSAYQEIRDANDEYKRVLNAVDHLNNRIKEASSQFNDRFYLLNTNQVIEEEKQRALAENDLGKYNELEHTQFLLTISTFNKFGKLQDLEDMYEKMLNISVEEAQELIDSTTEDTLIENSKGPFVSEYGGKMYPTEVVSMLQEKARNALANIDQYKEALNFARNTLPQDVDDSVYADIAIAKTKAYHWEKELQKEIYDLLTESAGSGEYKDILSYLSKILFSVYNSVEEELKEMITTSVMNKSNGKLSAEEIKDEENRLFEVVKDLKKSTNNVLASVGERLNIDNAELAMDRLIKASVLRDVERENLASFLEIEEKNKSKRGESFLSKLRNSIKDFLGINEEDEINLTGLEVTDINPILQILSLFGTDHTYILLLTYYLSEARVRWEVDPDFKSNTENTITISDIVREQMRVIEKAASDREGSMIKLQNAIGGAYNLQSQVNNNIVSYIVEKAQAEEAAKEKAKLQGYLKKYKQFLDDNKQKIGSAEGKLEVIEGLTELLKKDYPKNIEDHEQLAKDLIEAYANNNTEAKQEVEKTKKEEEEINHRTALKGSIKSVLTNAINSIGSYLNGQEDVELKYDFLNKIVEDDALDTETKEQLLTGSGKYLNFMADLLEQLPTEGESGSLFDVQNVDDIKELAESLAGGVQVKYDEAGEIAAVLDSYDEEGFTHFATSALAEKINDYYNSLLGTPSNTKKVDNSNNNVDEVRNVKYDGAGNQGTSDEIIDIKEVEVKDANNDNKVVTDVNADPERSSTAFHSSIWQYDFDSMNSNKAQLTSYELIVEGLKRTAKHTGNPLLSDDQYKEISENLISRLGTITRDFINSGNSVKPKDTVYFSKEKYYFKDGSGESYELVVVYHKESGLPITVLNPSINLYGHTYSGNDVFKNHTNLKKLLDSSDTMEFKKGSTEVNVVTASPGNPLSTTVNRVVGGGPAINKDSRTHPQIDKAQKSRMFVAELSASFDLAIANNPSLNKYKEKIANPDFLLKPGTLYYLLPTIEGKYIIVPLDTEKFNKETDGALIDKVSEIIDSFLSNNAQSSENIEELIEELKEYLYIPNNLRLEYNKESGELAIKLEEVNVKDTKNNTVIRSSTRFKGSSPNVDEVLELLFNANLSVKIPMDLGELSEQELSKRVLTDLVEMYAPNPTIEFNPIDEVGNIIEVTPKSVKKSSKKSDSLNGTKITISVKTNNGSINVPVNVEFGDTLEETILDGLDSVDKSLEFNVKYLLHTLFDSSYTLGLKTSKFNVVGEVRDNKGILQSETLSYSNNGVSMLVKVSYDNNNPNEIEFLDSRGVYEPAVSQEVDTLLTDLNAESEKQNINIGEDTYEINGVEYKRVSSMLEDIIPTGANKSSNKSNTNSRNLGKYMDKAVREALGKFSETENISDIKEVLQKYMAENAADNLANILYDAIGNFIKYDIMNNRLNPFEILSKETVLYGKLGEDLVAGTPDIVVYNKITGDLTIIDLKTSANLKSGYSTDINGNSGKNRGKEKSEASKQREKYILKERGQLQLYKKLLKESLERTHGDKGLRVNENSIKTYVLGLDVKFEGLEDSSNDSLFSDNEIEKLSSKIKDVKGRYKSTGNSRKSLVETDNVSAVSAYFKTKPNDSSVEDGNSNIDSEVTILDIATLDSLNGETEVDNNSVDISSTRLVDEYGNPIEEIIIEDPEVELYDFDNPLGDIDSLLGEADAVLAESIDEDLGTDFINSSESIEGIGEQLRDENCSTK